MNGEVVVEGWALGDVNDVASAKLAIIVLDVPERRQGRAHDVLQAHLQARRARALHVFSARSAEVVSHW